MPDPESSSAGERPGDFAVFEAAVRALPREGTPPIDLWGAISSRTRPRRVLPLPFLTALAAGIIGYIAGRGTAEPRLAVVPDTPLEIAAEVQRTGTLWIAALARLDAIQATPDGNSARRQGQEAALSAMYGATLKLTELSSPSLATQGVLSAILDARLESTPPSLRRQAVRF